MKMTVRERLRRQAAQDLLYALNVDIIPAMRTFILSSTLIAAALLFAACGSSEQPKTTAAGSETTPTTGGRASTRSAPASDAPPVATGHEAPMSPGAPPSSGGSSGVDTSALDQKIEQAEAKAKAANASEADRQAAAAAYLERANVFYNAGTPSLYKFALRDFRRTLRYDPTNEQALARQQQIVQIYQQMGRPVPELGNEP